MVILLILCTLVLLFIRIYIEYKLESKDIIDLKWPFLNIIDENGNKVDIVCIRGPLEKKEDIEYFNLYGTDFLHETTIRLDIRTYLSGYNHDITVSELIRIIKDNLRRDGYVDLRVTSSEPLSHLYRNMFRHAIEISYRKLNPS